MTSKSPSAAFRARTLIGQRCDDPVSLLLVGESPPFYMSVSDVVGQYSRGKLSKDEAERLLLKSSATETQPTVTPTHSHSHSHTSSRQAEISESSVVVGEMLCEHCDGYVCTTCA